MKNPTISPPSPKSSAVYGKPTVKLCTTADELTWHNIQNLIIDLKMNKATTLSYLVKTTYESETHRRELLKFYTDFWLRRANPLSSHVTQNRFDVSAEIDEMLVQMSWDITGKGNRSEFIRLLASFWAWKRNLLKFTK